MQGEAEDAGGLAPTKDDNEVMRSLTRRTCLFICLDCYKGLLWEGDGYLLLYKRLDNGRFQWPRNETEAKLLTAQQTRWLLEGLSIEQSKAIKAGKPGAIY